MKKLILSCLAIVGALSFSACETTDDDHEHNRAAVHSTTTTTEESTVRQPVGATTETRTIRSY